MKRLLIFLLLLFAATENYSQVQRDTSYAVKIDSNRQVFADRFGNEVGWFDFSEPVIGRKIWINSLEKYIHLDHSLLIPDLKNQMIVTFSLNRKSTSCGGPYYHYLFLYNFSGKKIFESKLPLFDNPIPPRVLFDDDNIYISGVDFESKNLVLKKLNLFGEIIWEQVVVKESGIATDLFISEDERFIGVVSDSQDPILVLFSESGEKIIEKELNGREKSCYSFKFFGKNQIIASWCWQHEQLNMNPLVFQLDTSEKAKRVSSSEIPLRDYLDEDFLFCFPIPNTSKFAAISKKEPKVMIFELGEGSELKLISETLLDNGMGHYFPIFRFINGKGGLYLADSIYEFSY